MMETRLNELSQLHSYVDRVDKEVTMILQNLQWDRKQLLEVSPMATCRYDRNHKLPPNKMESHEMECFLKCQSYVIEDQLLPDPLDVNANTIVKLNTQDVIPILNNAAYMDPFFKKGNRSQHSEPWTLERLQFTYTAHERRAIHDAVVQAVPSCHDLADLALPNHDDGNKGNKVKSRVEILAELRNMKRRRVKYRVAAKTRNYSDVLRDVIKTQMEHYTEGSQLKQTSDEEASSYSNNQERSCTLYGDNEERLRRSNYYNSSSHIRDRYRKTHIPHKERRIERPKRETRERIRSDYNSSRHTRYRDREIKVEADGDNHRDRKDHHQSRDRHNHYRKHSSHTSGNNRAHVSHAVGRVENSQRGPPTEKQPRYEYYSSSNYKRNNRETKIHIKVEKVESPERDQSRRSRNDCYNSSSYTNNKNRETHIPNKMRSNEVRSRETRDTQNRSADRNTPSYTKNYGCDIRIKKERSLTSDSESSDGRTRSDYCSSSSYTEDTYSESNISIKKERSETREREFRGGHTESRYCDSSNTHSRNRQIGIRIKEERIDQEREPRYSQTQSNIPLNNPIMFKHFPIKIEKTETLESETRDGQMPDNAKTSNRHKCRHGMDRRHHHRGHYDQDYRKHNVPSTSASNRTEKVFNDTYKNENYYSISKGRKRGHEEYQNKSYRKYNDISYRYDDEEMSQYTTDTDERYEERRKRK